MLIDNFEQARSVIYSHASKLCAALPELWGDPAVRCYPAMHETDAPNAVSVWATPEDTQTETFATNRQFQTRFSVPVYIRCTNSDESTALKRVSHIVTALSLIPVADPHLNWTVDRVDANVRDWSYGSDNQKLNVAVARLDFICICSNQDVSEVIEILKRSSE